MRVLLPDVRLAVAVRKLRHMWTIPGVSVGKGEAGNFVVDVAREDHFDSPLNARPTMNTSHMIPTHKKNEIPCPSACRTKYKIVAGMRETAMTRTKMKTKPRTAAMLNSL